MHFIGHASFFLGLPGMPMHSCIHNCGQSCLPPSLPVLHNSNGTTTQCRITFFICTHTNTMQKTFLPISTFFPLSAMHRWKAAFLVRIFSLYCIWIFRKPEIRDWDVPIVTLPLIGLAQSKICKNPMTSFSGHSGSTEKKSMRTILQKLICCVSYFQYHFLLSFAISPLSHWQYSNRKSICIIYEQTSAR